MKIKETYNRIILAYHNEKIQVIIFDLILDVLQCIISYGNPFTKNHGMPNCDKERKAGATGQQGMLNPLRYLIQPIPF